jgi:hypothetical protein
MARVTYTKAEQDALDHLEHMARFGWVALTGRTIRRATMVRLAARHLVRDAGMTVVVDGDGYALEPERLRQGWELTEAGRSEAMRIKSAPQSASGYLAPTMAGDHGREPDVAGEEP